MKFTRQDFISAVIILGVAFLPSVLNADDNGSSEAFQIIYIPGWNSKGTSKTQELFLLSQIFPKGEITVREWESDGSFSESTKMADEFVAKELADEIGRRSAASREKLVLVGHSLGGRIAIRTMALLARKKKPIRRGIFLASAIPNDDPDIGLAIKNSSWPNINVYCRQDSTLRGLYSNSDKQKDMLYALGAYGYASAFDRSHLLQCRISAESNKFKNHEAILYLSYLLKQRKILSKKQSKLPSLDRSTDREAIKNIKFQDEPIPMEGAIRGGWKTVEETFAGWRLEHKKIWFRDKYIYRIVDPYDYQRAIGSEQKMKQLFEDIKHQLKEQEKNHTR